LILDTNALSAFADGEPAVADALRDEPRAFVPVIVIGEFRYGIAQSRHRATYEKWLDSQLRHFETLTVTTQTASSYASLRLALKKKGSPVPANDAWIAALALQHRLAVLSRDARFDEVPGLRRRAF
jgi:tRNA(fMet)-specific endonuclease VapC